MDAHELRFDPEKEIAENARPAVIEVESEQSMSKGSEIISRGESSKEVYDMVSNYGNDLFGDLDMSKYDAKKAKPPFLEKFGGL